MPQNIYNMQPSSFYEISDAFEAATRVPVQGEPNARVVTRSLDSDCSLGVCMRGCSHLMWLCDACSSEGGWGATRDKLKKWAAEHVCPQPPAAQGEPKDDRENLITERTYGHGSITLTHYRSSGRIGVVQRGENSVMDVTDLLVFLQDSGLDEVFSRATAPDVATELRRGVTEWAKRFIPGDRWDTEDLRDLESALNGNVEANPDRRRARSESTEAERDAALAECRTLRGERNTFEDDLAKEIHRANAALAAVERVRAIHYPFTPRFCYMNAHGGQSPMTSVHCHHCKPEGSNMVGDPDTWPCETIQALDEAPEPEWEYGLASRTARIPNVIGISDNMPLRDEFGRVTVRRRKAGPWEPVGGEN